MTNQSETGTHLPWQPSDLPTLRAAYSDRTAALMAFLAGFAYRNSLSRASGAVEVPPELGVLGFDKLTIFLNEFVDGLAFIAESKDLVALSFRGTRSPTNWNTNFTADLTQPDRKDGVDPKVKVHKGFHDAFDRLSAGTEGLRAKMKAVKADRKGVPIYITGHSLGGALAQIATAIFADDQIAACYTFGSPRVGNKDFDLWVKPPSYRVVNYADFVPQIPISFTYRHSGDIRYLPDTNTSAPFRFKPTPIDRAKQFFKGITQFLSVPFQGKETWKQGGLSSLFLGIADHRMAEYERKLREIAFARSHDRGQKSEGSNSESAK